MTKRNDDGYLEEIQERMDGDVFRAMLDVMAQRVMEEELALHLGAERHECTLNELRFHRALPILLLQIAFRKMLTGDVL